MLEFECPNCGNRDEELIAHKVVPVNYTPSDAGTDPHYDSVEHLYKCHVCGTNWLQFCVNGNWYTRTAE